MFEFVVEVRYRTNSGCNTKTLRVNAETHSQAIETATQKVRNRRGVIKIDGGHAVKAAT
jgi:hypothetical protein